jgi:signal transduction histidine kinase
VVSATAQDDWIAIGVHNDGLAIPPALLGRIFEPLVHADGEAHARSAGSLGLGLFIVREIATAHGGVVTVTSSDTEGTTFTVRLPREPPAQRAAAE